MKTFKQFYEDKQTQQVDNWDKVVSSSDELQAALEIIKVINKHGKAIDGEILKPFEPDQIHGILKNLLENK